MPSSAKAKPAHPHASLVGKLIEAFDVHRQVWRRGWIEKLAPTPYAPGGCYVVWEGAGSFPPWESKGGWQSRVREPADSRAPAVLVG